MPADQMRIAMLSVHSCPVGNLGAKDTGGMSVYIRELAHELGEQGHSVDVYTRAHIYDLGQNTRLIHLTAGEDEEINKLAVYPYLSEFTCNLENFKKHNDLRYDLIFSHYWLSGQVGKCLQQLWQVPHMMMFHTVGAVKNTTGIGEYEPELRIEAEKDLTRDCHRIIAPTNREKENLILHYGALPERIGVVPCGVDLEQFKPMGKEIAKRQLGLGNDKIILFVGRIDQLKGIDQLLKAMPYLPNTQGLRLVIIGGDEHSQHEIEQLRKLSRDLHIQVVANDVGNLKSIIRQGETGYVTTDNTPHRLADKITLLLAKSSTDTEYALSIRASVSRFSWSNIAGAIIGECQLVLANYPTPVS